VQYLDRNFEELAGKVLALYPESPT
jgi:hypothetical protein